MQPVPSAVAEAGTSVGHFSWNCVVVDKVEEGAGGVCGCGCLGGHDMHPFGGVAHYYAQVSHAVGGFWQRPGEVDG